MPTGQVALGFAGALGDYLQQERERNRKAEDAQINEHMELIKALANRPDANPALLGGAIHDLMQLSAARTNRKQAKGTAGFVGKSELPVSQFLTGFSQGIRPIEGPTELPNPEMPSESNAAALGRMPSAGPPQSNMAMSLASRPSASGSLLGESSPFGEGAAPKAMPEGSAPTGGKAVLASPVPIPPLGSPVPPEAVRMVEAGRSMQTQQALSPNPPMAMKKLPQEQQPYFVSPEEMATKAGNIKRSEMDKTRESEVASRLQEGQRLGLTGRDIQDYAATGKFPTAQTSKTGASKIFEIPGLNGEPARHIMANPSTRPDGSIQWIGQDGLPLPPNAVPATTLGAQTVTTVDKTGNLWVVDKVNKSAQMVAGPGGAPLGKPVSGHIVEGFTVDTNGNTISTAKVIDPNDGHLIANVDFNQSPTGPAAAKPPAAAPVAGPPGAPPPLTPPPATAATPPQGASAIPSAPPVEGGPPVPAPDGSGTGWVEMRNGKIIYAAPPPSAKTGAAGSTPQPPATGGLSKGFTVGKPTQETANQRQAVEDMKSVVPMIKRIDMAMQAKYGPTTSDYPNDLMTQLKEIPDVARYSVMKQAPHDPVFRELIPLLDISKVVMTKPYLKGMRNYRYVQQIQKHMAELDLPLPHTPLLISDKLRNIKENFNSWMAEVGQPIPFPEVPTVK